MMTSGKLVNSHVDDNSTDEVLVFEQGKKYQEYLSEFSNSLQLTIRYTSSLESLVDQINIRTKLVFITVFSRDTEEHLDVLKLIKKKAQNTPVICITHFLNHLSYIRLANIGFYHCLNTPFKTEDISNLYQRIIDSKKDKLLKVLELMSHLTGMELSNKNKKALINRIKKRHKVLGLDNSKDYFEYFKERVIEEVDYLTSSLTTHTTYFLREPSQMDFLYKTVYPTLMKNKVVNIWSAACSTGEEVYSIAITILEYLESNNASENDIKKIKIIGTDIDPNSIAYAKNGVYTKEQVSNLEASLLDRFFDKGSGELEGYYRVKDELHAMCEFRNINLISDPYPVVAFDIIFARHVLMYFNSQAQKSILKRLLSKLKPGGHLCLSFSESSLGELIDLKMVYTSVFSDSEIKEKKTIQHKPNAKRVIIVDDSPYVVKKISSILGQDPRFTVVGKASNPIEAMAIMENTQVDLMTLDINMPVMDGLTYLDQIVRENPKHPFVVIISSVDLSSAEKYVDLSNLPEHEFIEKPHNKNWDSFEENIREVCYSVFNRDVIFQKQKTMTDKKYITYNHKKSHRDLIIIGSSTGGVDALSYVLPQLPANTPPIIVAQHMPRLFTSSLAKRMNDISKPKVLEASEDLFLEYGCVYICPGGRNTELMAKGDKISFTITDGKGQMYTPSVNRLFYSSLSFVDRFNLYGIILTGMGDDGALGMKELRIHGGFTLAQDESTSVVYGMPKMAVELGGVDKVSELSDIFEELFKQIDKKNFT
jgi:two-component system chemotaxis response regulator CheB